MKQRGMKYDNSIDKWPISEGEVYALPNGSKISINDITKGVPDFMKEADCVFIDPAGNKGVLKSYYTKADKDCPVESFQEFANHIKNCIEVINPKRLFVECFSTNKKTLVAMVEALYPKVRIYEGTYYHNKDCKCWIIQGTDDEEDWGFEGMDEWDVVYDICKKVPFNCIGDFFMGRGLVAEAAFSAGRKFVGSDMNRNRLAVGINIVAQKGGVWTVNK